MAHDRSRRVGAHGIRLAGFFVGLLVASVLAAPTAYGQQAAKAADLKKGAVAAGTLGEYRSLRFYLKTDLPPDEARELLSRLETMIDLISGYWGRPPRGVIACYVVKDLKNWPQGSMGGGDDEVTGRSFVEAKAGVTCTHTLRVGIGKPTEIVDAKSTVFAIADRGTPQHEAVHAYCGQTFGRTGPVWYSEGMAEMGQYWRKTDDKSVQIHPGVLRYLQDSSSTIKSLNAIINNKEQTGDSWQNYAWRWAVCHMLAYNTNYADRFRPLGLGLLTATDTSFEAVYGDMANEMLFEYLFFLKHIDEGYRVDLCSFDWKKKFIPLRGTSPLTSKILADHGWQPSQAVVEPSDEYEYTATGTWQLGKETSASEDSAPRSASNYDSKPAASTSSGKDTTRVSAHGDANGRGRLEGVILHDYQLSEPFDLDAKGTLKPPTAGQLWLRCRDKWNELADNKGSVTFKIKLKKP